MTTIATLKHKNPCPVGQVIYNFGRLSLVLDCYNLSLSDLCSAFSPNAPRISFSFVDTFFGHHYYILIFADLLLGV